MKKAKILTIYILLSLLILKTSNINNFYTSRNESDKIVKTSDSSYSGGGYIMNTEAAYAWEEINSTGTLLGNLTQFVVKEVNFTEGGWSFTFYNTLYDKIYVRTQGWMTFTEFGILGYWPIPSIQSFDYDFVALMMTSPSLDISSGGNIYYQFLTSPNRLVIEYSGMYDQMAQLVGDFEVIFYETGAIKFQYKDVYNVFSQSPVIGLDHGDELNYNSYTPDLPMQSKAIEFTFDQMVDPNFGLNFKTNEEFPWIVTQIDEDKLESFYGSDWEDNFGFLSDPLIGDKMKINISSIYENSTDWEISFDLWDWNSRYDTFPSSTGSDNLVYKKDPYTYNHHNLTNIMPLLLPNRTKFYLRRANLSHQYHVSDIMGGVYVSWHELKSIGGDSISIDISSVYNPDGILDKMQIKWDNHTSNEQKTIFNLETLTSWFLEESSLSTQLNDEHWFYMRDANDTIMQTFFGSNWEQLFGIPSNSFSDSKFKMKITSTGENLTHWITNYSLWDCIYRDDAFISPPTLNKSVLYLKEPLNYTEPHIWDPIFPLFLPKPGRMYTDYANLNYSFYSIPDSSSFYPPQLSFFMSTMTESIQARAIYSMDGYLQEIIIRQSEYDFMTGTTTFIPVLTISHFTEGAVPSYVGINPGETYSYGIFNCSKVYPYGYSQYKRMNITIDYISGEDFYLERVLTLINFSFLSASDVWGDDIDPYAALGVPISEINYIFPNSSENIYLFTSPPLFFEIGVDWGDYVVALEAVLKQLISPGYDIVIVNLTNGFMISQEYMPGQFGDQIYKYTSNGVLETISFVMDGKEFYTIRLNDFDYVMEGCDIYDPIITINSPTPNSFHDSQPPPVDLSIEEHYLDTVWYNLDNVSVQTSNYTYTGSIPQGVWDQVGNGTVTITFYANDTNGNEGFAYVIVNKDIFAPDITINSPADDQEFTDTAPTFDLTIIETNLDSIWYSFDDGVTNYPCGISGQIDGTVWDSLADGILTLRFYAYDLAGNVDYSEVNIEKDVTAPDITINSPTHNQEFTDTAPTFDLTIVDPNLDSIWYSFDNGITNYPCGISGQIDGTGWDSLAEGMYTLRFYANDTFGYEGYSEVIIIKTSEIIPGFPFYGIAIFLSIGIIAIIPQLRKKIK